MRERERQRETDKRDRDKRDNRETETETSSSCAQPDLLYAAKRRSPTRHGQSMREGNARVQVREHSHDGWLDCQRPVGRPASSMITSPGPAKRDAPSAGLLIREPREALYMQ